jgi:23S rRNA (adenine2503-C2)-methyltransferase
MSAIDSQSISQKSPGTLLDVPFGEWKHVLDLSDTEAYRVRQAQEWVFRRRVKTFAEMTNIPAALREKWAASHALRSVALERRETSERDGTSRLFFRAKDGKPFSAVFLPAKGEDDERHSLCVSTQVGCAWGCVFCASGRVAFQRNLASSEILEQVLLAEESTGQKIDSVLFMGMGEPLANYRNLLWALQCLRSPLGFGYGARHVTVSTSGLVPQILSLAREGPKVNLAISLHAADDDVRRKILPKSSAWPIKDLLKAAWAYQKTAGSGRVTFEYILLKGINDSHRTAQRLANLLRAKKAWVNLIAYNPVPGLPYEKPSDATVRNFAGILSERGVFVRLRKPQGTDIAAGCGQLGAPKGLPA